MITVTTDSTDPRLLKAVGQMFNTLAETMDDLVITGLNDNFTSDTQEAAPTAPGMAPAAAAPAPAAAAPAPAAITLPELVKAITSNQAAGLLNPDEVTQACLNNGVPSLPLLASRPDLVPTVHAELEQLWVTRGQQ